MGGKIIVVSLAIACEKVSIHSALKHCIGCMTENVTRFLLY
ncbi:hypothetical protein [Photorhabdus stackebrandtii]